MPQIKHYVIAIRNAYKLDSFYKNISDETIDLYPNYRIAKNGLLYIVSAGEARLCIPAKCDNVIRAILHDFHESDIAVHSGICRCYQAIRQHFYWIGMFAQIESCIRSCTICQRN